MGQYFDEVPTSASNIKEHKAIINHKEYFFMTDNGVFSKDGLDDATKYLLESLEPSNIHGRVLDFGCGYGPIGIYLKDNTDAVIDMVDINERALSLARMNAKMNNVSVNIFKSNVYDSVSEKYNYIITNPPIRVGKKMLHEILFGASNYLCVDGQLWLVVSKNQGAKSLARDLEKTYIVTIIDKIKGFYIICCQKH